MKAEKGNRKLAAMHETAMLLLVGLVVCLATACLLFRDTQGKVDGQGVDLLYKLFAIYAAGLTGKATAFMWGNAQEHKSDAAAKPPTP